MGDINSVNRPAGLRIVRGAAKFMPLMAKFVIIASLLICRQGLYAASNVELRTGSDAAPGVGLRAGSDAARRASGNIPAAKTEKTVKTEKELEKLAAAEKKLKEQISEATINRTKLLAKKRAELKQARQKRDAVINGDIDEITLKKTKQAVFIAEVKSQLAAAKKKKNIVSQAALEVTLKASQGRLDDINAELKKARERLAKSYQDYKVIYDNLTRLDAAMKNMLDENLAAELKLKEQKADFTKTKGEYNDSIKNKDYLTAERRMDSLVFIQTGIVDNYSSILNIKLKVKNDYHALIVNYYISP